MISVLETMNSCFIVGHIHEMPVPVTEGMRTRSVMKISCTRPYPEPDGTFTQDVFTIMLWRGMAEDACSACNKGDAVAVKGRLIMEKDQPLIIAEHMSLPATF